MNNVIGLGAIKENAKLYWVIGKWPNLRITTNRPKGRFVREPYDSLRSAEIGRRNLYTEELYARMDAEEEKKTKRK